MSVQDSVILCSDVQRAKEMYKISGWEFLGSQPEPGMPGFCRVRYDDRTQLGLLVDRPHTSKLSAHFSLSELVESQEAARHNLDNTPSAQVVDNLIRVCGVLESIRAAADRPVRVSSGYRSEAVNAVVGGAINSMHIKGLAADINVPGMTPKNLATMIASLNLPLDQLILEYDTWVHIGLAAQDAQPRKQTLTIRTGTGYRDGIS